MLSKVVIGNPLLLLLDDLVTGEMNRNMFQVEIKSTDKLGLPVLQR
jgi:hypothetical protein